MATVLEFKTTPRGSVPAVPSSPLEGAVLVVVHGERPTRSVRLSQKPATIGRGRDCDIRVHDDTVSRRHCICWIENGKLRVRDLGSTNTTLVNGQTATDAELQIGDYLSVGSTIFRLVQGEALDAHLHGDQPTTVDALTQLANRRHFRELLDRAVSDARSMRTPLCLVLLDLDHFQHISDTFGHVAGEDVLRAVGRILRDHLLEHDAAGRLGGEEFALLLSGTPMHVARNRMQRLRRDLAEHRTPGDHALIAVTASIGIAELNAQDDSAVLLMRTADRQRSRAKQLGRNRICSSLEDPHA